ncbi:hypothetical protein F4810DRAFT_35701 [Camillea tinctor]|nr:hypothetical protein F4810DRAFT_35701 [Camillea tinctor]
MGGWTLVHKEEVDGVSRPGAAGDCFKNGLVHMLCYYLGTKDIDIQTKTTRQSIINLLTEYSKSLGETKALNILWDVFCTISGNILNGINDQTRLAELIDAFVKSPETKDKIPWAEATLRLYNIMWLGLPTNSRISPNISATDYQQWVNQNVFWAQLNTLTKGWVSVICYFVMYDTFMNTRVHDYMTLNFKIPGAAQWILYNGEIILGTILFSTNEEKNVLFGALAPWTMQTWDHWKKGFKGASRNQNLLPGARELSKRASDEMILLEEEYHLIIARQVDGEKTFLVSEQT